MVTYEERRDAYLFHVGTCPNCILNRKGYNVQIGPVLLRYVTIRRCTLGAQLSENIIPSLIYSM